VIKGIVPSLWFDGQAEQAAQFYTSIFPDSRITGLSRFGEAGPGPEGTAIAVDFELRGQPINAINGGPEFKFTEAISLRVDCADQAEVDEYWEKLGVGGEFGPCGWLKDRYGLSWQIVPVALGRLLSDPDPDRARRAMDAMLKMSKLEVDVLEKAAAGG
jgi:predicted 3-demethylubiquinone-9 3-methyltransferase (glyoxalase superfamily)